MEICFEERVSLASSRCPFEMVKCNTQKTRVPLEVSRQLEKKITVLNDEISSSNA